MCWVDAKNKMQGFHPPLTPLILVKNQLHLAVQRTQCPEHYHVFPKIMPANTIPYI